MYVHMSTNQEENSTTKTKYRQRFRKRVEIESTDKEFRELFIPQMKPIMTEIPFYKYSINDEGKIVKVFNKDFNSNVIRKDNKSIYERRKYIRSKFYDDIKIKTDNNSLDDENSDEEIQIILNKMKILKEELEKIKCSKTTKQMKKRGRKPKIHKPLPSTITSASNESNILEPVNFSNFELYLSNSRNEESDNYSNIADSKEEENKQENSNDIELDISNSNNEESNESSIIADSDEDGNQQENSNDIDADVSNSSNEDYSKIKIGFNTDSNCSFDQEINAFCRIQLSDPSDNNDMSNQEQESINITIMDSYEENRLPNSNNDLVTISIPLPSSCESPIIMASQNNNTENSTVNISNNDFRLGNGYSVSQFKVVVNSISSTNSVTENEDRSETTHFPPGPLPSPTAYIPRQLQTQFSNNESQLAQIIQGIIDNIDNVEPQPRPFNSGRNFTYPWDEHLYASPPRFSPPLIQSSAPFIPQRFPSPQLQPSAPFIPQRFSPPQLQPSAPFIPQRFPPPQLQPSAPFIPQRFPPPQTQPSTPFIPRCPSPQIQPSAPFIPRFRSPQIQQSAPFIPQRFPPPQMQTPGLFISQVRSSILPSLMPESLFGSFPLPFQPYPAEPTPENQSYFVNNVFRPTRFSNDNDNNGELPQINCNCSACIRF